MATRIMTAVKAGLYHIQVVNQDGSMTLIGLVRQSRDYTAEPTRTKQGWFHPKVWQLTKAGGEFEKFKTLADIHAKYPMANYPGYNAVLDPMRFVPIKDRRR